MCGHFGVDSSLAWRAGDDWTCTFAETGGVHRLRRRSGNHLADILWACVTANDGEDNLAEFGGVCISRQQSGDDSL